MLVSLLIFLSESRDPEGMEEVLGVVMTAEDPSPCQKGVNPSLRKF